MLFHINPQMDTSFVDPTKDMIQNTAGRDVWTLGAILPDGNVVPPCVYEKMKLKMLERVKFRRELIICTGCGQEVLSLPSYGCIDVC
jgi:hypothetical protein